MSLIVVISVAAAAIAVIAVAALLIPVIKELRETIRTARGTLDEIDRKLVPILGDMEKVAGNLKIITDATAAKVSKVEAMMNALGETGEKVQKINTVLSGIMFLYNRPASYWAGTKAAWKYIADRMKKKGG